jgi:DNA-binding response OmpR family regulator
MAAIILLIGMTGARDESFVTALEKRYKLLRASSGKQGIALAKEHYPQVIVLDAISMRTPGDRICQTVRNCLTKTPIIHLHPGPEAEAASPADVVLFHPFTWRKVINSIERLLNVGGDEIIRCGPFSMHVNRRVLVAHGQETQLTPKQAHLIETFLRHPGEVLDRKTLMEKVWETDYLGDTRTLDVHIRWLRRALENGTRKPRFLKTIRGVGYQLDIPVEVEPV